MKPLGAIKSKKDKRTIKHESLTAIGEPLISGGCNYYPNDIKNQHSVGICTAISLIQNREKATGKKYSYDFQYLLQKKFYDNQWLEGSSILNALKVGKKYGFLPAELWTHTTEDDLKLPYSQYIAKLSSIPDNEVFRLISLCGDRIGGYALVDVNDSQSLAKAIVASKAGILCRFEVGCEWWTAIDGHYSEEPADIDPLRPPQKVISGHAIVMPRFDYLTQNYQIVANTWGTDWNRQGLGNVIWDKYKPTEAWIITEAPVILPFNNDLRMFMSGPEVKNLQNALKLQGFFNYESTGYFGPITWFAVKAFQKANGILNTGYVGPLTRARLNAIYPS